MTLSSSSLLPSSVKGTSECERQAADLVERMVKYRHHNRRFYHCERFELGDLARVQWMKTFRLMLVRSHIPHAEIVEVMDWALTTEKWPPIIRKPFHLRENYPTLLDLYRQSLVADLPHEPWGNR